MIFKSTCRFGHPAGVTAVLLCTDVAVERERVRAHLVCLSHLISTAKFGI